MFKQFFRDFIKVTCSKGSGNASRFKFTSDCCTADVYMRRDKSSDSLPLAEVVEKEVEKFEVEQSEVEQSEN